MKKRHTIIYLISVFILAQIAWFSLLGLWIYWYVSNYIIFTQVGEKLSPQMTPDTTNVFALVSGLVLLVIISIGMSIIFLYLNRQLSLTKLYDNFIGNVTHELKSPLSSIQLYLETLDSRNVQRQKQKEFISLMIKDVKRLNNLINSILYISGVEQRKTVHKYPHDYHIYQAESVIRELVNETAGQLQIPEKSIKIEGQASCQCVIDRYWLRIVFANLFDNAIKYSKEPVEIKITLRCRQKYFFMEISDQGIGISPKDQKKIFNKFERIYSPDIPNVKGTGLGLYWVKEIIKYHGGKISVNSQGSGFGSTFRIELPVYQASRKRYIKNLLKRSKKETDNHNE